MKKLRRWSWHDPVYDVRVFLLRGPGALALKWINRTFHEGEDYQGEFHGAKTIFVTGPRGTAVTIWVPWWWSVTNSRHLAVLAHETTHAAIYVLGERGVVLSKDSEEAFTYWQAWMFEQCHLRLKVKS